MVKTKKKNLSESLQQKNKKQLNPFEVHINRDKQKVLGRKSKNDHGLPGISRAKAINRRKQSLLQEYTLQNKNNVFLDKRIGEKNCSMSIEDKATARFAKERMKAYKKESIFNLNDEILTHRGQTLEEIEKFDDPRSDDEFSDNENVSGKLERNFVQEAHFGGGILSKADSALSRKDLIDQLIAESKKQKAEKQKIRKETIDLTEKLDSEWRDLLPVMSASRRSMENDETTKTDTYDIAVRQLKFEARGNPSEKLKSEEQIIQEEKEKLEKLEADRLARMKGFISDTGSQFRHKSADDLDDGFIMETIEDTDDIIDDSIIDTNINEEINDEDDYNDDKQTENELEDTVDEEIIKNINIRKDSSKNQERITHVQNSCDKIQQIRNDLLKRKEIMEKARNELSYTYNAPESFEELEQLLGHHNADYQSVIVDRIIKCNHWTLDGRNREKMSNLFVYLLQHINNCASTESADDLIKCFQIFDRLCPYLYDLAHMNSENAKICIQEVIEEKYDKFEKNKTKYPGVDTLIFFKLVSLLFPTSDFRHPITTPCLIFMSQILLKAHIRKYRSDISKGLFICTLILEYTILSKRFAPSVINFLRGIIYIATPASLTQNMKIIPPFKTKYKALVVNKVENTNDPNNAHMFASDLIHEELDDIFRIRSLLTAVNLLIEFKNQLQELEAVYPIFEHILQLLKINDFKQYPLYVRDHIKKLRTELEFLRNKKLEYIVQEKKRPKPLKTYEPKIMTVYSEKRYKSTSKEKAEREKLLHKYKREHKGAIREIRRDRDFLAKVQIGQQIKSDTERKQKVNEIFGEAAIQQNEFKKMKKRK
ncbi:Nucleolar protein 14 [Trachymyrmex septentrionalis]|uniref:Nucleolar protein 14 n=1 Tax=Trachymyrmex septentrionalis TaxID=34720 RepID=A0A195EXX8_9HYME|nr:Nucleolar protein 14 [Trachymyrmex septentrionalis]